MNKFHGRLCLAVALMLTASCDNGPVGPPNKTDVTVVVKIRTIPSQEGRAKPHFPELQIRIGSEVYSAGADGIITVVRSKNDSAVVMKLEQKGGTTPFFKEAETLPMKLVASTLYWDVLPLEYVVPDGQFAGQRGPVRVKENCELYPGQDIPFYHGGFCDGTGVGFTPVWKYPIGLSFDSSHIPSSYAEEVWDGVLSDMSVLGGGDWFALAQENRGVKARLDTSLPKGYCRAWSGTVMSGEVIEGRWSCQTLEGFMTRQRPHELAHLLGLGHKCGSRTAMVAAGCLNLWTDHYTLQDVVDIRVWLESWILANSAEKSTFGLREVLQAERSE